MQKVRQKRGGEGREGEMKKGGGDMKTGGKGKRRYGESRREEKEI